MPIGVSILPRFAATVCIATQLRIHFSRTHSSVLLSIIIANGTKVISATSFVIIIDIKKHNRTNVSTIEDVFLTLFNTLSAIKSKIPSCLNTATIVIRQKSIASVLKSIYVKYCLSGLTASIEITANTIDTTSTVSVLTNLHIFFTYIFILTAF